MGLHRTPPCLFRSESPNTFTIEYIAIPMSIPTVAPIPSHACAQSPCPTAVPSPCHLRAQHRNNRHPISISISSYPSPCLIPTSAPLPPSSSPVPMPNTSPHPHAQHQCTPSPIPIPAPGPIPMSIPIKGPYLSVLSVPQTTGTAQLLELLLTPDLNTIRVAAKNLCSLVASGLPWLLLTLDRSGKAAAAPQTLFDGASGRSESEINQERGGACVCARVCVCVCVCRSVCVYPRR